MKKKGLSLQLLALMLLVLAIRLPCAFAEQGEVNAVEIEAPAPEAGDLLLGAPEDAFELEEATDPGEDGPESGVESEEKDLRSKDMPDSEPVQAAEPDEEEGEELVAPVEAEFGPDESGRINRIFDGMVDVSSATWRSLNLKRVGDYQGKIAYVTGKLVLEDILIEGAPACGVCLLDYFDLAPGASIACTSRSDGLSMGLSAFSINKGENRILSLEWNDAPLASKKAKWYTSDKQIATVSNRGKVTAKGKGQAIITVKYSDETAICSVDVTNIVYARKLKLNFKKLEVALNCVDASLKAIVSPDEADVKTVIWSSSAPKVASVDGEGRISGLSEGVAIITGTLSNGKTASCEVTVRETRPAGVDFEKLFITLHPGETYKTGVVFTPENVTVPGYTLTSDDEGVCVTEGDVITATGVGSATVTVRSDRYPEVMNTCRVSVIPSDSARLEGLTIGINPGHQIKTITEKYPIAPGSAKKAYGVKTGACGKYTKVNEYETNLAIGLKLQRILESQGAKVVITRTSNDVMLTNIDRAKMLNDAHVDVALQLHCNSGPSSKHGNSAYIRTTGEWVEESRAMAAALTGAISEVCGCANLGVKIQNEYMSLNWSTTPSVLLEMGYISNRTEDDLLASDDYREQMALGISEGLAAYFGR